MKLGRITGKVWATAKAKLNTERDRVIKSA